MIDTERLLWSFVCAIGLMACGGSSSATPGSTTAIKDQGDPPADQVALNSQNAPPPDESSPTAVTATATPTSRDIVGSLYLWCQSPSGALCATVSREFGLQASTQGGLPQDIYQVDSTAACNSTGPKFRSIVNHAGSLLPGAGRNDQVGTTLRATGLGSMFEGGGCLISSGSQGIKVHLSSAASHPVLIRVWEQGG